MKLLKPILAASIISGTAIMLTSCGVPINVIRYPSFWTAEVQYSSMAVAPTRNFVRPGVYEGQVSSSVVRDLVNTGTYTVYDHTHEVYVDNANMIYNIQTTGEAELILFNNITDYHFDQWEEDRVREERYPVYVIGPDGLPARDEYGNKIVDHEEIEYIHYPWFFTRGNANITSSIVRTQDGQTIYSKTLSGECTDDGPHPHDVAPPHSMVECAVQDAANSVYFSLVPIYKTLRVPKDDLLKVVNPATGKDKFTMNDQVVVTTWLPKDARMNSFTIDIVPKDTNNVLVSNNFTWESNERVSYSYSVSQLVESAGGARVLTVRFLNGSKVAFTRDIEVK